MKRMLSLGPRRGFSGRRLSQLGTDVIPSSVEEEIVIPKRIPRGPTDILRALQSTIHKDPTAAEYKYIDDPYLIPISNFEKRSCALSKESGRNAARYMLRSFPECFKNNPAEPDIPHFNPPREAFKKGEKNTEEDLLRCIEEANLAEAEIVYENLGEHGVQVNDETLLKLLQIASFYNGTPPADTTIEEKYYQYTKPSISSTWQVGGLADSIFERIENKNAEAYSALIQGVLKHMDAERGYRLYEEMREKDLVPSVQVYNLLIQSVGRLKEDRQMRYDLLKQLLGEMGELRIQPNLRTFNSVLETCSWLEVPASRELCPKVLNEMEFLKIEPSLGTYSAILKTMYRKISVTTVIGEIMKKVAGRAWEVRDKSDFSFLPRAMEVLSEHDPDKELAYQLLDLAEQNSHLFQNNLQESIFFRNFFEVLCVSEDIDQFMQVYNRLVPNTYSPEATVLEHILDAVELHRAYKYLPQLWSDTVLLRGFDKETILKKFLTLTAKVERGSTEESEKLQKQCVVVAHDLFNRVFEINENRKKLFRVPITLDAEMISNLLQTFLNGDNMEYAKDVLDYLIKNQNVTPGVPSITVLKLLAEKACEAEDRSTALRCAVYCADIGHEAVMDFVREQAAARNFGDEFLSYLNDPSLEPKNAEE